MFTLRGIVKGLNGTQQHIYQIVLHAIQLMGDKGHGVEIPIFIGPLVELKDV